MLDFINPVKQVGDDNKPSVSVHDTDEIAAIVATLVAKADVGSGELLESAEFGANTSNVVTFSTKSFNVNTGVVKEEQNLFLAVGNITLVYDATSKNITLTSIGPVIHRVNHMWTDINSRKPMEIATVSSVDNPDVKLGDFVVLAPSSTERPYAFGIVENVTSTVMNVLILIETITKYTYGGVLQFEKKQYFPQTGEKEFIYIALDDTWAYYWNGTTYVLIDHYKLPASMVKDTVFSVTDNVLTTTVTLVDPITGTTSDVVYTTSGGQLKITQTEKAIIISVEISHDDTLAGVGTSTDALKLAKVYTDSDTLGGAGISSDVLKISQVYTDADTLSGKGISSDKLKINQVYTDADTLGGKGISTDKLKLAKVYTDDDTLAGSGISTNKLKIKKVYTDNDTLAGTGTGSSDIIKLNKVYTDNTLKGAGTSSSVLAVDKDKTSISHDASMIGSGVNLSTELLGVDIEVDGNTNYGRIVYTGDDNRKLTAASSPVSSLPTVLSTTVFKNVRFRSKATASNPIAYTPPTLDGIMMFKVPSKEVQQLVRLEFLHTGCWLHTITATGVGTATKVTSYQLANETNWLPGIDYNHVLTFYSDTSDYNNTWKFMDNGIVTDVYDYVSLNDHIDDTTRHITATERTNWNGIATDLSTHTSDKTIHVTSTNKSTWDAKVSTSDLTSAIEAAKLNVQKWLAAVNTKADLPAVSSITDRTIAYLCRVINDTTVANNGVWQLTQTATAWTYYSDNLDFVDEAELATALAGKVSIDQGTSNKNKILIVDNDGNITASYYNGIRFTFIVDSQDKFYAWIEALRGNDYTYVLIAPGTYTSDKHLNLNNCGTKKIVGMPGSILNFSSAYGLYYPTAPATNEYLVEGVNVVLAYAGNTASSFYRCTNLINCIATMTNANYNIYAYNGCTHLYNCTATVTGGGSNTSTGFYGCTDMLYCNSNVIVTNADNTGAAYGIFNCTRVSHCLSIAGSNTATGAGIGIGFVSCTYVTNCRGEGYGRASGGGGAGMQSCNYVTGCYGYGKNASSVVGDYAIGFYSCYYLSNCLAQCQGVSNAQGTAFLNCAQLSSCRGDATSNNSSGQGFGSCTRLVNCKGSGTSTGASTGYAFSVCKGMLMCSISSTSTTSVYNNCYVSSSGSGATPADTAEGGWNTTVT
jgi:hypothetical protein